jgi:hypothetical protein
MDDVHIMRARAPIVASPALVKRRSLRLERVTMRPAALPRPASARRASGGVPVRRVALGAAAVAAISSMPLAYAGAPGPAVVAPLASEMRCAEPLLAAALPEPPVPSPVPRPAPRTSVDDEPVKVDGVRPNPYLVPARARIQRRVPRGHDEPRKVSDLKPNPYD